MQLRKMFLGTRRFGKVAMLMAAGIVGLWSANAHADITEVGAYGDTGAANGVAELTTVNAAFGNYNIKANGTDFWFGSDHGVFAYDPVAVSGDFTAIIRSVSVGAGETLAGEWGRTGIMARADGTAANSPYAGMIRKSGGSNYGFINYGFVLQGRDTFGGSTNRPNGEFGGTEANNVPVDSTPVWLALSRRNDIFYANWADDNGGAPGTWSDALFRKASADLTGDVVLGLAHHSHNIHPTANTAVFEGFSVGELNADLIPPLPRRVPQAGVRGDVFVSVVKRNDGGQLTTIAGGKALLANPGTNEVHVGTVPYISVGDPESGGRDFAFPGLDNGIDDNDFVSQFTGYLDIPADGVYTFRTDTDDNSELVIGGADFTLVSTGNAGATTVAGDTATADSLTGNTNMVVETFLTEGAHPFEFTQIERGGEANASLMVLGNPGCANLGTFGVHPVFEPVGLYPVYCPEPSTFVLAGLGVLGMAFVGYRRRRNG